ncbi:hypothetical protein CEXT_481231 [Caerostris extrusa]|uniref:Secreted protein n=1 Tax=Caerostris extrusa TaxID=172846 RepID=A0AAV4MB19_CAEEX|nr:hypothetical protein CEXT_481231 [Caerostris extrusa]
MTKKAPSFFLFLFPAAYNQVARVITRGGPSDSRLACQFDLEPLVSKEIKGCVEGKLIAKSLLQVLGWPIFSDVYPSFSENIYLF